MYDPDYDNEELFREDYGIDDDFMELGDSGWVSTNEGQTMYNVHTGNTRNDIGQVFDSEGVMIYDPTDY